MLGDPLDHVRVMQSPACSNVAWTGVRFWPALVLTLFQKESRGMGTHRWTRNSSFQFDWNVESPPLSFSICMRPF